MFYDGIDIVLVARRLVDVWFKMNHNYAEAVRAAYDNGEDLANVADALASDMFTYYGAPALEALGVEEGDLADAIESHFH
jgi:hypothetical protein